MADTSDPGTSDEPTEMSFDDYGAQRADGELVKAVAALLQGAATNRSVDIDQLESVIVPIFVDMRAAPLNQVAWYFPDPAGDYRALHALNACRLAIHFGLNSGMDDGRAVQLGTIALFYDVGMWLDDMPPVLESRSLTQEEFAQIEQHPTRGGELLASISNLDPLCARIAEEHHERADGTGYPSRLPVTEHHAYSRLLQLIDSFLGMIEPRSFRKAISPVEAMQRLAVQAHRGYFNLPAFRDWLKVMGVYPVGSFVTLNTGELAIIEASGGDSPRRPKILVLADELLDFRMKPMAIDLQEETAFEVAGPFTKFPKTKKK